MKINSKSWHWKLNKAYFNNISDDKYGYRRTIEYEYFKESELLYYFGNTLCSYFWGTVSRLFVIVFILSLIWLASSATTYTLIVDPLYMFIAQLQTGNIDLSVEEYVPLFVIIGLTLLLTLICLFMYSKERLKYSDSLVLNYIEARKNKYCPKIEVE